MNEPEQTTGVFFPPRIVKLDLTVGDSQKVMDNARDRYLDQGVVLLDTDGVRKALAIINYAAAFPEVCDPEYKPSEVEHVVNQVKLPELPVQLPAQLKDFLPTQLPTKIHVYSNDGVNDPVNHPKHYTFGKYEVIDVIEDWKLDFHRANALKYIARAGRKEPGAEIQDLEKAVWYLQRRIAYLKKS